VLNEISLAYEMKKFVIFVDAVRKIEYPVLREGINKIQGIHELYKIAKR